jgi:hypothetical protein
MRNFVWDSWSVSQGLNPGPAAYKAGVLPAQLHHLVLAML